MLSCSHSGGVWRREHQQSELATLVEQFTFYEGVHQTAIAPLHLFRSSTPLEPIHGVYKPVLCLIAQGRKQVTLAEDSYTYDTAQYLLVAVDLPVISHVTAIPQEPFLSLSLNIDPRQISTLIMEAELPVMPGNSASKRGITIGYLDPLLLDAVIRLLGLGRRRKPFWKVKDVKASKPFVTSVVTPSRALVAFFIEANRLADVARERATALRDMIIFSKLVDLMLPMFMPIFEAFATCLPQPASSAVAKPELRLSKDIIKSAPLLPRNLIVVQFHSRPRCPHQKLTIRVGK